MQLLQMHDAAVRQRSEPFDLASENGCLTKGSVCADIGFDSLPDQPSCQWRSTRARGHSVPDDASGTRRVVGTEDDRAPTGDRIARSLQRRGPECYKRFVELESPTPLEKMQVTADLFRTALDLQRQTLRRRNPHATDAEIERLLDAWLADRPGAEHGDGVGLPASRFPSEP